MPLRDDLLNPVSDSSPAGENLRYAPIYDKIKEARREDDDAPQGEWTRTRKTAEWPIVIKLCGEAIATKSKDLQLAVWLTEALLKKEGFSGLREGLTVINGLLDAFWDTCFPELEDGDAELRAVPLDWLGGRFDATLRSTPITRNGLSWYKYKESRAVGYEADADSDVKLENRTNAINEGKITGEDWDAGFNGTAKDWYVSLEADIDATLEILEALSAIGDEKFGDSAPSFSPMRSTLEEVRNTVHTLLNKKRESQPDAAAPVYEEAPAEEESTGWDETPAPQAAAPRTKPRRGGPLAAEPVDREDACQRVIGAADFLRREDPGNPAPFLLLRALRWGELRAAGYLDPGLLDAPPTEIRQALKKLSTDGEWQQLLDTAETAMGLPCGRGWLDIQRHAYRACYELSYTAPAAAIQSAVKSILADLPDLLTATLLDDTPAANAETQAWIEEINPPAEAAAPSYAYTPAPAMDESSYDSSPAADKPEDPAEIAMRAAREGRPQEAIEILTREAAAERSGRGRFQRRLQLAQLCTSMGHERIAHPILEQLVSEIDNRSLEGWESPDTVAHVLALLYRCLDKLKAGEERKQLIYDRICRLDPIQALSCTS
jgi:type VI secretion system protein ImpA